MIDNQEYLILDYETVSEGDLKKLGAWNYCRHPSTRILCVSSRKGTRANLRRAPIECWMPPLDPRGERAGVFKLSLNDLDVHLVAHNSFFEYCVTRFVLPRHGWNVPLALLSPKRWTDTAALAATHALPRPLDGVTNALELAHRKDMEGHRLMMKMSKPRKPTKNDPSIWHRKVSDLKRLAQYCNHDIAAETEVFLSLPPLSPFERKVWELDQEINIRGVAVDLDLVESAIAVRNHVETALKLEGAEITGGIAVTQRDRLLEWCNNGAAHLEDLTAKTVSDALKGNQLPPNVRRVLEIRQDASKSSVKKYDAFLARTDESDGRLRGSLIYHAASTGRWAGSGVQPQNFPRGAKGINGVYAAELVRAKDLDTIELLYGSPMDTLSTTLRPCFVAGPGRRIVAGDFNAIELRVLFWIAGHLAGLQAIRENRQMYREMGEVIFDVKLPEDEGPEREVGKRAILGCGFGMGWAKFMATCEQFGSPVEVAIAKRAVNAYRSFHSPVPQLWKNLEKAAISAVERPGYVYRINRTEWWVKDKFLYCKLPSGRVLPYMHPSVKYEEAPWGEMLPKLYHYGVNPRTKKWGRDATWGGVLTENVIQATARDLMAAAMLRLEANGYPVVLTVHDEVITEPLLGHGSVAAFERVMAEVPPWAADCPVKVKAFEGPRYRK